MTFNEVLEQLRDGRAYRFGHKNIAGFFFKAPFPSIDKYTEADGAHSAITFWHNGERASPTLMLYDFDDETDWYCQLALNHPGL